MSLISPVFLISFVFLFVVLLILNKKSNTKTQNLVLLIYSICVYGIADLKLLAILILEIILCYFSGLYIFKNKEDKSKAKAALKITVAALIAILAVFKYFNFFTDSICALLAINNTSIVRIILPIGISFYTFLGISYIADVYLGKINEKQDFVTVALYISFFPAITSGPITRASELIKRITSDRTINMESLEAGLQIFLLGLFKKIVIADRLSVYVDTVYGSVNSYSGATLFTASIAYSLQLYCDFSGYSDMAIGVAKMIGIDLKKNFNLPYISKNPTEFWKRWHISLSEWLQNYLYIPLGGNRKGEIRTYINLLITMLLGGLWHGADWKFVIWGGVHGIALVIHKLFRKYVLKVNKSSDSYNDINKNVNNNINKNLNKNINANVNKNINANVNNNINKNINTNINTNINKNINKNINTSLNKNINANKSVNISKSVNKNVGGAHENGLIAFVSVVLNFIFVNFCWILFRAKSISEAVLVIKRIFTFAQGINYQFVYFYIYLAVIVLAHIICMRWDKLKNDINSDAKNAAENDTNSDAKNAIENDTKSDVKNAAENDTNSDVKNAIENDINSDVKNVIENDTKSDVKNAIENDINNDCEERNNFGILGNKYVNGYHVFYLNKFYNKIIICIVLLIIVVFGYYGNTAFIYAQF